MISTVLISTAVAILGVIIGAKVQIYAPSKYNDYTGIANKHEVNSL